MEIDVVSRDEFENLEGKHRRLLSYLGLEEIDCNHPQRSARPKDLPQHEWWRWQEEARRQCPICRGEGVIIQKKEPENG